MDSLIRKLYLIVILGLACVACSAIKPIPVVYYCPEVKLPKSPMVPVHALKLGATPDQVIKSWVATAEGYKAWHDAVLAQYPQD